MCELILEATNVTKNFPGVRALESANLFVKKGQIMGLIGENGAGKSTILKILTGTYAHNSFQGEIKLKGENVHFFSPHDAIQKGIGFVPQEISVMDNLTIAENLFVGHLKKEGEFSISQASLIKRAKEFLSQYGIDLKPHMRVRMLNIGQKQLLMIARALSWNPEVLILDEPTSSLAQDNIEIIFNILKKLKEKDKSIVFVTHKLEEIFEIADYLTVFRDGCNINSYERKNFNRKNIISDMVGREITSMYPSRDIKIGEEVMRVEDLTVEHPKIIDRNLIEGISFRLHKGEVLGLCGLVGSGRTETLSTIFGQYKLKKGKIFIQGKEVYIRNENDALKNGLAMVTEDRKNDGLLMLTDIKTNIVLSNFKKIIHGIFVNAKKEKTLAKQFIDKLKIKAPSSESMVITLSGGNQQKVVLAKALNVEPLILMLDEPTKGIDVASKREIYILINKLVSMGISIIMVSSELPEVLEMCDRLVVIAGGKKIGELSTSEASQESVIDMCFA